jgi:hypothetical protein
MMRQDKLRRVQAGKGIFTQDNICQTLAQQRERNSNAKQSVEEYDSCKKKQTTTHFFRLSQVLSEGLIIKTTLSKLVYVSK